LSKVAAQFSVRAATAADAGGIARVHQESWRTSYTGILPRELIEHETSGKGATAWRRRLASAAPDGRTWLVESTRDGIIGFASCGEGRAALDGLDAEIYALYVIQSHQRMGAGRMLMRACAGHFVRQGLFGFYLWVLKANRARLFYEAMGGREVGEKQERLGLHRYDEVAYGWHDLAPLLS
jgi:ribosomal protein S18 acetylase RimI-like enzyme